MCMYGIFMTYLPHFNFQIFLTLSLPHICLSVYEKKPVTSEWKAFWRERNSAYPNTVSTCPWYYKKNPHAPLGSKYYVALNPIVRDNCLNLDLSTASKRVHSNGRCWPVKSHCGRSKVVGFTCIDTMNIPVDKRSSGSPKDTQQGTSETSNGGNTTTETLQGIENEIKQIIDNEIWESVTAEKMNEKNNNSPDQQIMPHFGGIISQQDADEPYFPRGHPRN